MRLFAALPLPHAVLERLTSLRLRLSSPRDGLRWSEPEQWHITLQFYGDGEPSAAACLQQALTNLEAPAPQLTLEGLELFPAKGILFASLAPSEALAALQAEIVARSRGCGMLPESRPYKPHITLARSRGKTGDSTLRQLSTPQLPTFGSVLTWQAYECLLLESTLRPQGAQYAVQARLPLTLTPASPAGN